MKQQKKKKPLHNKQQHQSAELHAVSSTSSSSTPSNNNSNSNNNNTENVRVFSVNFKECLTILSMLVVFSGLSICVGIAAGISISISYFDSGYYMNSGVLQRTTILDPSIQQNRVLHTTSLGHKTILQVVDDKEDETESAELPKMNLEDWIKTPPRLCPDGRTVGYDTWYGLRNAVNDANLYAAERFNLWRTFFKNHPNHVFDDPKYYYEEEIVLTICPNSILRGGYMPIYVNTENLVIECEGCVIRKWGSHFSFLPDAKGVKLIGLTFEYATSSVLVFRYDGAEVSIEDCVFRNNRARYKNYGTVCDLNSTSVVNICRSYVDSYDGPQDGISNSLAIRQHLQPPPPPPQQQQHRDQQDKN